MTIKKKWTYVWILILILIVSVLGLCRYVYLRHQYPEPTSPEMYLGSYVNLLERSISLYYMDSGGKDVTIEGLMDYIQNTVYSESSDSRFCFEPPIDIYVSEYDMDIYLSLPMTLELESDKEIVIGYAKSGPFKRLFKGNQQYWYIIAVSKNFADSKNLGRFRWYPVKEQLQGIVDKEILQKNKPDMYYWHERADYNQEHKSKQ